MKGLIFGDLHHNRKAVVIGKHGSNCRQLLDKRYIKVVLRLLSLGFRAYATKEQNLRCANCSSAENYFSPSFYGEVCVLCMSLRWLDLDTLD